jgi:hypothetical protein
LPHEVQQLTALFNSICALLGAAEMQFSSHDMFWLHPWTHVMTETHAWSWAHACVTEQQFAMTQLAHEADVNAIPQAPVMPPPLPPPPLPPPPPPLPPLPPPDDKHGLLQLCSTQLWIPWADERHEGSSESFEMQACDAWAEALYWPFGQ